MVRQLSKYILILPLLFIAFPALAQIDIELIEDRSRIWIEGSSTVHDIHCVAGEIVGYANVGAAAQEIDSPEDLTTNGNGSVKVNIPVWQFDCGRRQMNRDFFRALKADDYPEIQFEYYNSTLKTNLGPDCHPFQLEVEGLLTVAGTGKDVTLMVDIEPCEENHFTLKGSKVINMKDFGIDPPSALFGLIRAHEELEVFFSLTARQKSGEDVFANGN